MFIHKSRKQANDLLVKMEHGFQVYADRKANDELRSALEFLVGDREELGLPYPSRNCKKWTTGERKEVVARWVAGQSLDSVARELKRTESAVARAFWEESEKVSNIVRTAINESRARRTMTAVAD